MQQYPMSPDVTGQQPPVYHQDPNAAYPQQQPGMYPQQPQQQFGAGSPPPQQYPMGSPPPAAPYTEAQHKGMHPQPGMPPQQPSGPVYQNATPIANLNRGSAPADCPACGQRSMTTTAFETGNSTQ
jgi:lipopolysaccharide-induced tumor necrosis factor-alpha factor